MRTYKRILIQTAADDLSAKHFNHTVIEMVALNVLKPYLSEEDFQVLQTLGQERVPVWGFTPHKTSGRRTEWEHLQEGDYVFFYGDKHFYHRAVVHSKVNSPKLAKAIWHTNKAGAAFEYIYFMKDSAKVFIPFEPEVIGYKKSFIQGAVLLDKEKSQALIARANDFDSFILDINTIEPSQQDEKKLYRQVKVSAQEVDLKQLQNIQEQYSDSQVQEKVQVAKILVRNQHLAKAVKRRDNYICQICGAKPFMQNNGLPYAEAHHVWELAEARIDHVDVMITVCPTCHRVIHYGTDDELDERYKLR